MIPIFDYDTTEYGILIDYDYDYWYDTTDTCQRQRQCAVLTVAYLHVVHVYSTIYLHDYTTYKVDDVRMVEGGVDVDLTIHLETWNWFAQLTQSQLCCRT